MIVTRHYSRRLWFWTRPWVYFDWVFGVVRCWFIGHDFGPFMIDDFEGPCVQWGDDPFPVPVGQRPAHSDEPGTRVCRRWCGAIEYRGHGASRFETCGN